MKCDDCVCLYSWKQNKENVSYINAKWDLVFDQESNSQRKFWVLEINLLNDK